MIPHETYSAELNSRFHIALLSAEPNTLVLSLRQREYVVMQALVFPGMNLLWAGCILMVQGCFVAMRQRFRQKKSDLHFTAQPSAPPAPPASPATVLPDGLATDQVEEGV
ncbi:hypothetical protein [Cesiribacter andamanensis]|uniref:Uncharacterized protein n=1 Tax=Cesiribacter andamanensis AMV16 TaxID=1279009 RepID=M7MZR1_9BACT|nr:hypothetical protein [Cesiribacter andamanensis]EMR01918.1 hypothetical protein ADICEAN_02941 [Cesiribacter andamanensis AMV16]